MEEIKKKRKIENSSQVSVRGSKVFAPFRVIGNVINKVPFEVGTLGSTFYIVTSVGKSFQIYDANNLHLLFISEKETDSPIVALATHFHYVFAAFGNKIGIYRRGIEEHLITLDTNATITSLCVFGDYLCTSTDDNVVHVFKKKASTDKFATSFYTKFEITELQGGDIVSIIHLPTYLNKVVVVTKSNLILFNVRTGKIIYTSEESPNQITTVAAAPALDILALGTVEGEVILYNLRKGKKIFTIKFNELRISTISFRTDGSPHICVGATNGDIIFYDLNRRSRIHVLKNIHKESFGGVSKAMFLNGQPIIVTSGGDNSLKEYVFDPSLSQENSESVVQPPRFLRSRGGHSQPPSSILFADSDSHFILSASRDKSLWAFSLRKDSQSQELSQRMHKKKNGDRIGGSTIKEKFPEIIAMAIENARVGEWENVITAHKDEKFARTWDLRSKRVGRWTFDTTDDGFVKSVAISQCGNFGFVGSSNGSIVVYNMQSGLVRRKYKMHKKAVTGIALDGMNRKMVSCGLDGIVGFYDFNKSTLLGKLTLDAPITSMVYHRTTDLVALSLDDFSIVIIDVVTQKIVRQLWGHSNRITSLDFSPDGRWIVSASLDATMRTWDLPTGGCIDGLRLETVATNVKFSPKGDYLMTSHVSGNGICAWTNKGQFKAISTRMIPEEEFVKVMLPNNSSTGNATMLEGAFDDNITSDHEEEFLGYDSVSQIDKKLKTFSVGPRNKMNTLLNLDVIRNRSKPTEAPKKPEKTPFFLSLTGEKVGDEASGREGTLKEPSKDELVEQELNKERIEAENRLNKFKPSGRVGFESKFTKLLREGVKRDDYSEFLENLVKLSPANVDLEIRSLDSFKPFDEIVWFINALTSGLKTNNNFELYEAFMSLLFKAHGDVIHMNNTDPKLAVALHSWDSIHNGNEKLDHLVKFCSEVVNFVSTI
ncbi:hypothetical protein Kpol_1055p64 [Vanderwaltozyma polyspora DSM 70294]|uniref:Uncharacterized protein n=1 Tax=Vanderwaltozyma polyspora (strain ATCC 22028 / DSM 70294 / BCRC 21397 / CBS 2163 / NBRC 10782 / NRRL Y-8283 / UCD 57-17) TaxID=436907 RepID=A7TGD7_VANPO|nr:uncharacterized protein Kpol_1055p64 [Vanderwaltozyma polyspora DSM 70294]EDO18707.1 hypothetical protein Kpol_1055p64 [Vanderwaltozyma polyspora DSM 70294]